MYESHFTLMPQLQLHEREEAEQGRVGMCWSFKYSISGKTIVLDFKYLNPL